MQRENAVKAILERKNMVTETEEIRIAHYAARHYAKQLNCDWRDLLTGCWIGAREGLRKGHKGSVLLRCCMMRAYDLFRTESGLKRKERPANLGTQDPVDSRDKDWLKDLVTLWGRYKDLREGMCPRTRIALYLISVEGYSQVETAVLLGVTKGRISQMLTEMTEFLARKNHPRTHPL